MTNRVQLSVLGIIVLVIVSLWLTFGDIADNEQDDAQNHDRQVELVYVEWASEIASTYVVKVVLEQLGYEVDVISISAAAMWQAVASGDVDGHIAAWLPTTHAHYLNAVQDNLENLGPNLEGTKIGLVVPSYVTVDSIEELNGQIDRFDGKIIGIDPGAGLMSKTEQVMEDYKLDSFKLIEGSGATMTAALAEAIRTQEWIVVTGWTPHWKFARWQLKYLKDPKNVYGQEEYIGTVVRKGLKEEMPTVYRLLDNFYWTAADMGQVMIMNQQKGTTPDENAKRWVDDNPDKVKKWLSQ